MPTVRGFRRGPKIDEAEWALVQSRTAARLSDIFGIPSPDAADPVEPVGEAADDMSEASELESAPLVRPRPPIIVIGDAGPGADRPDAPEPVGVMAQPSDNLGDGGWSLLVDAGLFSDLAPAPVQPRRTARRRSGSGKGKRASVAAIAPVVAVERSAAPRPKKPPDGATMAPSAFCPSCALVLDPPPIASRRCTACLQRIVVKRVNGRAVYLTEAALLVFDAERRRAASSVRLNRERDRWLRLATAAGAPADRIARLANGRLTDEGVSAARALYLATVERAVRAAKHDRDWEQVARIRRDNATELYRIAGSPLPLPPDILALFRDGVAAELRGIAEISRDAELVSATCCDVCRSDSHQIYRIARELRQPHLPHDGCPRGLCRCRWDLAERDRTTMRRYLKRRTGSES